MPYTESQAQTALGTVVAINTGSASSPTYTTIGEITSAPQSGRQARTVEVTNLQSTNVEWIATLIDSGVLDVSCNLVSGDAGQLAVEAAFSDLLRKLYKVTVKPSPTQTTGDTYVFSAIVEESNPLSEVGPDKALTHKFKLKISGLITFTAGS
jgi:hypothetical protein